MKRGLATVIRDSADVRIVENARPPDGSRLWQVGPEPSLSIGDREGGDAYMLYQVADATKLSDGRIVVANGGDDELRVFDASGNWLESWGGRGEGSGEFEIGEDYILGRWRDELEVEYVQVWSLER